MEIAFLLDKDASISVLNPPTFMMITQRFKICNHHQYDTSKTLSIANQSELPFKQNICETCFLSIETKSSFFMIASAVTDIEYCIPGTPFFEN